MSGRMHDAGYMMQGKSEIRSTKSETNPKSKYQIIQNTTGNIRCRRVCSNL
jgi:hypothetical protein